jgi:5-methylcytosine-specific restriction endonuclease McrA
MDRILIEKVQNLRNEGKSFGEISKELLITKSNASYCSKIDLNKYDAKMASRDKYIDTVCALAKKCSNINQILKILGKKSTNEYYKQIKKILEENNVNTSHFTYNEKYKPNGIEEKKSLSDYLVIGSAITISKLRNRLIKEGVKEHKCEKCGRTEWEGEIIPLQLHHINGDRTDNRLENLQLLCPNCHALTDNYCGRKLKAKKEKTKVVRASKMVSKE